MTTTRIEGGFLSPSVSRQLSGLVRTCSFFARVETNGWLDLVKREGHVIETMDDVPTDIMRLLTTGSYRQVEESSSESNLAATDSAAESEDPQ